ncbi:MAG: hypothetical protein QGG40_14010, partial [Myxococcota bacterium]|nr:hypothetical protein [Myxococcota bacterium]
MLRTALSRLLFPLVFGAALAIACWGVGTEVHQGVLLAGILASVLVIILVFERVHPEHTEWNQVQGDVGTDLVHVGVSGLLVPRLVEAATVVLLAGAVSGLTDRVGSTPWPDAWPLGAQLVLAMLVSQFFEYWFHRLAHTV